MEQELADTNETLSDLTCQNQAICGAKIKCEQVRMDNVLKHVMTIVIRRCAP